MLRFGSRFRRIGTVPITNTVQYSCFHQSTGLFHRTAGRSRRRIRKKDDVSDANIPELPSNIPVMTSAFNNERNTETYGPERAGGISGSELNGFSDELDVEDMKDLDQQITASSEGKLSPIVMRDIDITGQYAPLRNGLRWIRVPHMGVVLPLPSPESCAWQWRGWTSEGEFFGVGTRTAIFAPIPAGPNSPSVYPEDNITGSTEGNSSPGTPAPASLSGLQGLLQRTKARLKDTNVHIPRGFGLAGYLERDDALYLHPPDRYPQETDASSDTAHHSSRVDPGLVDPTTLPARITVRGLRGVLQGPLGELIHRSPRTLARLLVDMHAAKHGPRGYVTEQREKRPPQILSAWSNEDDSPRSTKSSNNTNDWMSTPDPAAAFTTAAAEAYVTMQSEEPVKVFGVEYEVQTDDPMVVYYDENPRLRSVSQNSNNGEVTASKVGRMLVPGSHESLFTSSHKQFTTMRHSVTVIIDTEADCVHEISLSAPANYWDDLWEGSSEPGDVSSTISPTALDGTGIPELSAESIGVLHRGLRMVLDNAVVTDSGGIEPVTAKEAPTGLSIQEEAAAHHRLAQEEILSSQRDDDNSGADDRANDGDGDIGGHALGEVPSDLRDAVTSLHDRETRHAQEGTIKRNVEGEHSTSEEWEEEELDVSGFYESYVSKSGASYPVFVSDDVLKERERIKKQREERKRVPKN